MNAKDETGLQIIATHKAWQILLNILLGLIFFFFAFSFFIAAIFVVPPPIGDKVYFIPWILWVVVTLLALLRNKILAFIFEKIPRSTFLSLIDFGRALTYTMFLYWGLFFIAGLLSHSNVFAFFSLGLLSLWFPIYLIFSMPLTPEGEAKLLFKLLFTNIDNFEKRQLYLKKIAKAIENQLKKGNIKVSSNEFVYYFNIELLKGKNIRDDLKVIESWMVNKKTPCFESLMKIYPKTRLEPWKRASFFRQIVENPTMIKYVFNVLVIAILIAISPELRSEIVKFLSALFGI